MDERTKELIAELKEISRFSPNEELDEKPTRFPCKRCGGTGWIFYRMEGVDKACRCPECREVRDMHFYLRSSGIKPENYEAFTMERFKTDNIMAYEMKKLAQGFLKDPNAKGLGFFGRPGTGKTHICIATCQAMKREHHYWQYRREIQRIKAVMYKNLDRYDEMITRVSRLLGFTLTTSSRGQSKAVRCKVRTSRSCLTSSIRDTLIGCQPLFPASFHLTRSQEQMKGSGAD